MNPHVRLLIGRCRSDMVRCWSICHDFLKWPIGELVYMYFGVFVNAYAIIKKIVFVFTCVYVSKCMCENVFAFVKMMFVSL